ncbi:hypothetical protein P8452_74634 [Trifolium repens]|nr:hypothetical protein P8452_74634 [Trifolium repens]
MQLITNDKFLSVKHRVLAQKIGPRVSVACFFRQHLAPENLKLYGPIMTNDPFNWKNDLQNSVLKHFTETTKSVRHGHDSVKKEN